MNTIKLTLDQVITLLQSAHALHPPVGLLRQTAHQLASQLAKLIDADHSSIHLLHQWNQAANSSAGEIQPLTDCVGRWSSKCLTGGGVVTMFSDASYPIEKGRAYPEQIRSRSLAIVSIACRNENEAPEVIALGRDPGRPTFIDHHLHLVHAMHRALPRNESHCRGFDQKIDLPPRQKAVLEYLKEGRSEKQVAMALNISRHTVHNYVKIIYRRFRVSSRSELLSLWLQHENAIVRSATESELSTTSGLTPIVRPSVRDNPVYKIPHQRESASCHMR